MLRRMSYRSAGMAFLFAALWFVLGLMFVVSPIPGALGIGGQVFVAWFMLFLIALAGAGASLTLAAINGIFPPGTASPRASEPAGASAAPTPLPWSGDVLPQRPPRRRTAVDARPAPARRAGGSDRRRG